MIQAPSYLICFSPRIRLHVHIRSMGLDSGRSIGRKRLRNAFVAFLVVFVTVGV